MFWECSGVSQSASPSHGWRKETQNQPLPGGRVQFSSNSTFSPGRSADRAVHAPQPRMTSNTNWNPIQARLAATLLPMIRAGLLLESSGDGRSRRILDLNRMSHRFHCSFTLIEQSLMHVAEPGLDLIDRGRLCRRHLHEIRPVVKEA
jgi:hypothetical protein